MMRPSTSQQKLSARKQDPLSGRWWTFAKASALGFFALATTVTAIFLIELPTLAIAMAALMTYVWTLR